MPQPDLIVNPLSGEEIVIVRSAAETGGQVLDWELRLAPGGRVPSSHVHPGQRETFTVLDGRMRFRVGWRRFVAGPGQRVAVPPGAVHHFANAGQVTARVAVESRPALRMEELLETAAALAQDQHRAGRALPRPLDLALFMTEFEDEVAAPYLPRSAVRLVMRRLARSARTRGLDAAYQRLRARQGARTGKPDADTRADPRTSGAVRANY
ncbi:MAG TPA: cupin domain-containing protein [Streptosporangiaceae bacterium]|nr:cupin domain-containing protein [Streptosporangiaceae bacterium]